MNGRAASVNLVEIDPMYGPAVRCKKTSPSGMCGLASMYPAFAWSLLAPGHHGYQRACDLISG
jgi:hypothetical protein